MEIQNVLVQLNIDTKLSSSIDTCVVHNKSITIGLKKPFTKDVFITEDGENGNNKSAKNICGFIIAENVSTTQGTVHKPTLTINLIDENGKCINVYGGDFKYYYRFNSFDTVEQCVDEMKRIIDMSSDQ